MRPFELPPGRITPEWVKAVLGDEDAERKLRDVLERRNTRKIQAGLQGILDRLIAKGESWDAVDDFRRDFERIMAIEAVRKPLVDAITGTVSEGADLGVSVAVDTLGDIAEDVDWDLVNTAAKEWADRWSSLLITDIDSVTQRETQKAVARWIENGDPLSQLVKDLEPMYGRQRAELIATTETTRSFDEANKISYAESGVVEQEVWRTAMDDLVCVICGPLNGKRVPVGGSFDGGLRPPAHPNCILPGNVVTVPGRIIAATKSFYDGPAIELTTCSGGEITVTANHPILTGRGWVAADSIRESDSVLSSDRAKWIAAIVNPDYYDVPAPIEEVFESLQMAGTMSTVGVPTAAEQFHSDGRFMSGDVNVVYADRFLPCDFEGQTLEPGAKHAFSVSNGASLLDAQGIPDLLRKAYGSSSDSIMGGGNLSSSFVGGHTLPFGSFGLTLCPECHAMTFEEGTKAAATNASLTAKFVDTFAAYITHDPVLSVRQFNYSGHVYDLQSDPYELYFTDSIVTHNCRCQTSPIVTSRRRT